MTSQASPLYGLILSGGMSSRMGEDKALLSYHEQSQLQYLRNLLRETCTNVFVSAKNKTDYPDFDIIEDHYEFTSPLNGIASAILKHPDASWLIVACDMPNIEQAAIDQLVNSQSNSARIHCFKNREGIIEPLLSIWGSGQLTEIENYLNSGRLSAKGYIESCQSRFLTPTSFDWLLNINTPTERDNFFN